MLQLTLLDRRTFLKLTGISASGLLLASGRAGAANANKDSLQPSVFLSIAPDGQVTIIAHRSEMGQGVRTSLPQILADELEADWQRVSVVQARADKRYGRQDTDGSRSIRDFYQPLREIGAATRTLLEQAAADIWQVPRDQCQAAKHSVRHLPSGRSLDYARLVEQAKTTSLPRNVSLKTPQQFRYIGRPMQHIDLHDIVQGKAKYGIDIRLPGMRFAAIARAPVLGSEVLSFISSEAMKVSGVLQIIEMPKPKGPPGFRPLSGVAVIAESSWAARRGVEALRINWSKSRHQQHNSEDYAKRLRYLSHSEGLPVRSQGNVEQAFSHAAKLIEADYRLPYLAHAAMEPLACSAHYRNGEIEIWAPCQDPQTAQHEVATLLNIDEHRVRFNVTLLGGGFGRKAQADFVLESAWLSKQIAAPLKICWSREDDIRHDYYHAMSAQYLKAGLDQNGRITAWLHRSAFPAIATTFNGKASNVRELSRGCVDLPFDIANIRIEGSEVEAATRIGWLRSVANIQHAFAINSFISELAHACRRDPAEFLLSAIGPARLVKPGRDVQFDNYGKSLDEYPIDCGRLLKVTRLAMQQADWHRKRPPGHGLGIAAHRSFLSYVATVVEIQSTDQGKLKIARVSCVADVGQVVDPERVRAQLEGGTIFGLSLALHGVISFADGQVQQSNFHDYPLLRLREVPPIDVQLVDSGLAPTGIGEPGTPPLAPALTNAIFAATGRRIRQLPLSELKLFA